MLGAPLAWSLHQHIAHRPNLRSHKLFQPRLTLGPQQSGPALDHALLHHWHPLGRCARAGRIGKHVQKRQAAFINNVQRVLKHRICLSWKARNNIRPKNHVGAFRPQHLAKFNRMFA